MFGFWKKNKTGKKMTDQELVDYFYSKAREQVNKEPGNADYSFFKELGSEYLTEKVVSDYQDTIIKSTIYNAIKDAVCTMDINALVPYLKDLSSVPKFQELASSMASNGETIERLQYFREKNTLDAENNLDAQLDKLQDDFSTIYEAVCEVNDIWSGVISSQDYAGGSAQEDKEVLDTIQELEEYLLVSFSNEKIEMLKSALLSYALNYVNLNLDNDNPVISDEGERLMNLYDLFYESPYKTLFGIRKDGKILMTEDILISKIIIEGVSGQDMRLDQLVREYMTDNQGKKDFQRSINKVRYILSKYDLKEQLKLIEE